MVKPFFFVTAAPHNMAHTFHAAGIACFRTIPGHSADAGLAGSHSLPYTTAAWGLPCCETLLLLSEEGFHVFFYRIHRRFQLSTRIRAVCPRRRPPLGRHSHCRR